MSKRSVIRKDSISEYCITNGQEVRPYFGTQFNEGDKISVNHFAGSCDVGVGIIGEANFRKGVLEGKYELWGLSGVDTHSLKGDPPSKTLSQSDKLIMIRENSRFMTYVLREPYEVKAMNDHIARTPGNRAYPFGNIANLMYAHSKCKKDAYKPYPGLFD